MKNNRQGPTRTPKNLNEIEQQLHEAIMGTSNPELIIELIDAAKQQRRKHNPDWRETQTMTQKAFWNAANVIRETCVLEVKHGGLIKFRSRRR